MVYIQVIHIYDSRNYIVFIDFKKKLNIALNLR